MNNVKEELKRLDAKIREENPTTEDGLIKCIDGRTSREYGFSLIHIYRSGHFKGIRICICPRSKKHYLPSDTEVYKVDEIFPGTTAAEVDKEGKIVNFLNW